MEDLIATQQIKILQYCAEHGSITNREASMFLDINSPTKCISILRDKGYNVQTETEHRINSSGRKVRYYRYYITEPDARGTA